MTVQWNKAETKNRVLTENTAQAVFKYLTEQESNRASMHTRWIWELLQNARDASIEDDNSIIAAVKFWPGELTFSHSGSGFNQDQIGHLIYHGSTKVEEEETIGRYGSGFLTTHLLSSEIDISGQLDDGRYFDFRLARKPDSVVALRESMNEAWENFNPSTHPQVPMPSPFTTRFVYPIIDDDAADAVAKGIETLKQCAPFVVVFNQEFSGIDIEIPDETTRFKVFERKDSKTPGIQQITVVESRNGSHAKMQYLLAQGNKVSVAIPLKSSGDRLVCQPVEKTPRLFLGFPLVGTEDFSFPAVINSLSFTPTENRDGVYLAQSDNEANRNNQAIIEEACELLVDLLRFTASSTWHNSHLLAEVPAIQNKVWLNTEWLRTCIRENLIEKIRESPAVINENGNAIAPKDAWLPLTEDDEDVNDTNVEALWDLMNSWQEYHPKLPLRDEAAGWCQTIKSWADIYESEPMTSFNEVTDGRKLALHLEKKTRKNDNYGKCEDLQDLLREDISAVEWLNQLHHFFNENRLRQTGREYHIVLDQSGHLGKLSALHRDQDIDEELKEMAGLLDWPIREELRDKRLTSLAQEVGAGDKSSDEVLDKLIERLKKHAENNLDDDFKEASARLFAWIVGQEDWNNLRGFPVFVKDGKSANPVLDLPTAHAGEPPLAPVRAWHEDLQQFSELFPSDSILADDFFEKVSVPEVWKQLDEQGLIRTNMIIRCDNKDLKELSLELSEDDQDHETAEPIRGVTDFVERDVIMDRVRDSRERAYLFWRFLTEWLIKQDSQNLETKKVKCESCEEDKSHEYYSVAWLVPVRDYRWIRQENQRFSPNAQSLANLLRDNEWEISSLGENTDAVKLLETIGVPTSDLKLELIAKDEVIREGVINLATTLYGIPNLVQHIQDNENLPQNLEKILDATEGDLSQVVEDIEKRQKQRDKMVMNQHLGQRVEELVGSILDELDEGFNVTSVTTGADFEISDKAVDTETSDLTSLEVTQGGQKWWIEVKSTRIDSVTMSPAQTKESLDKREKFLLCIVPIESENTDLDSVRENMRFVKNIPKIFGAQETLLRDVIKGQEELQAESPVSACSGVELVVEEGKARIRVQKSVWEDENIGFRLEDLVEHLK